MSENLAKSQSQTHWPSVWQFALSLFGILALWGISMSMLFVVFGSILTGDMMSASALVLNAAGTAFTGVLLIPSLGYSLLRLLNKPISIKIPLQLPLWIIILLLPVLLLGHWAVGLDATSLVLLPFLHVLAAGISVAWLLALGLRGLSVGSPQRAWGILGMGLVAAPLLSLIVEFIALIGFGLFYLLLNPELLDLAFEFSQSVPAQDPEQLLNQLEGVMLQPSTLYLALLFGALVVPLVEELFKPIGVWLLAGRKPTPAQGFAAGLLSGAGYALFENFTLGAGAGEDWAMVVVARMGTSLVHILTAGLTGWALTLAWTERRYLRLALSYLVAVAIHALWNGTVILTAIVELMKEDSAIPDFLTAISAGAPMIFVILILGCFVFLLIFNRLVKRTQPSDQMSSDALAGYAIPSEGAIIPPAQPQPVVEIYSEKENL
jgi:hypothetical protein